MEIGIFQISCGRNHLMAIDSNRALYALGEGSTGCLGLGDIKDKRSLAFVHTMKDKQVIAQT